MDARIANFESNQFSTKNSVKILKENLEQNNSSVTHSLKNTMSRYGYNMILTSLI